MPTATHQLGRGRCSRVVHVSLPATRAYPAVWPYRQPCASSLVSCAPQHRRPRSHAATPPLPPLHHPLPTFLVAAQGPNPGTPRAQHRKQALDAWVSPGMRRHSQPAQHTGQLPPQAHGLDPDVPHAQPFIRPQADCPTAWGATCMTSMLGPHHSHSPGLSLGAFRTVPTPTIISPT